jgi:hypothetical protein
MNKKFLTAIIVVSGLFAVGSSAYAQGYYYPPQEPPPQRNYEQMRQLDLSLSIAEGGYINYRCDIDYCEEVFVAPFSFELLAGYRLTRFLSLDLALNFSFDYYGYNYYTGAASEVFVWASLRPGIRLFLPAFFHYQVYFRAAVPLTFRVNRYNQYDDVFLPGLLFGVGVEWVFGTFGFFIEGDILPYFVEVYPGYYLIPAEGRIGVAVHF